MKNSSQHFLLRIRDKSFSQIMLLGSFKTKSFPYLAGMVFFGFLFYISFHHAFIQDETQDSAQYFCFLFGGFWVTVAIRFFSNHKRLEIYEDKIILELI